MKHKSPKTLIGFSLLLLTCTLLESCTRRHETITESSQSAALPVAAKPFHNEIYRTIDDRLIITLVSPDELELRQRGTNLICKYSKQENALRVVASIMGTSQALYYKITPQGLEDNDGTVLFSPEAHKRMIEDIQLTEKRKAEGRQKVADEVERSRHETNQIAVFKLFSYDDPSAGHFATPDQAIISDVSVKVNWPVEKNSDVIYFGDISSIGSLRSNGGREYFTIWFVGGKAASLYNEKNGEIRELRKTLLNAFSSWRQKYPNAVQRNFEVVQ